MVSKIRKGWFETCLFAWAMLHAPEVYAQSAGTSTDILGPAASTVDDFRLSQSIGLLAAVAVTMMIAWALIFRSMKVAIGAALVVAGVIVWYTGGDTVVKWIPTSGTRISH